jgi:hypothetical protein
LFNLIIFVEASMDGLRVWIGGRILAVLTALTCLGLLFSTVAPPAAAQEEEPPQGEYEFLDTGLGVPAPVEPADDSFPTYTPTFRWTAVSGIDKYVLEYTSDPTCTFGAGSTSQQETVYTSFTPTQPFPNDVNYCWRVRTKKGTSVSPWSPTWSFIKRWYFQPELLTPVKGYQYARDVLFSWTPVPGAAFYKIEINNENSFPPPPEKRYKYTRCTANTYYNFEEEAFSGVYYWRVIPVESNSNSALTVCKERGNEGRPSAVSSFRGIHPNSGNYPAPQLISPLYNYEPHPDLQPHEDRIIPLPIFQWHRTLAGDSQTEVAAYRVEVDDVATFQTVNWTVDTENLSAAPSAGQPFLPDADGVYYWRVCALDALGGSCLPDPTNSLPMWSEVWAARIDLSRGLPATNGTAPTLLRPVEDYEAVETFPLLEWKPLQGASRYEVQISLDPSFEAGQIVDQAVALYPVYTPFKKLDSAPGDPTSSLPYGTYYWRVRALDVLSVPLSGWTDSWRFQVAAQSHWVYDRSLGNLANQWKVASDPDDVTSDGDELTDLFVPQSSSSWFFGFHTSLLDASQTYGLYLDVDHQDGSGATVDPQSYPIGTVSPHRPEYAVYILGRSGATQYTANDVFIYAWNPASSVWGVPQSLLSMGGNLLSGGNYLELRIPNIGIGMEEKTGSMAISMFSVNESTGLVQDTVPGGDHGTLNRFASVTERLMLVAPATNASGDPTLFPSALPFFWHWPPATHWEGYRIEVALDPQFTTAVYTLELITRDPNPPYLAGGLHTPAYDFNGDNTYYWRVRPQYWKPYITLGGAWSLPMRFERKGFAPKDLQVTFTYDTPTFAWQRLEGAEAYELEVDNDPEFGSPEIKATTSQTTYSPVAALKPGTYYLRVRALRHNEYQPFSSIKGDWTSTTLTVGGANAVVYLPLLKKP